MKAILPFTPANHRESSGVVFYLKWQNNKPTTATHNGKPASNIHVWVYEVPAGKDVYKYRQSVIKTDAEKFDMTFLGYATVADYNNPDWK